jgi:signal transduction histidine kinase
MEVNNPQVIKFLSIINNSIKKFRGLVKDISAIAKLESDLLALEAVDLNEILDNIEWSLEDKIKESGTVINRNLEIKQLLFSKKNLRSILYNLISNAIKFKSENAPEITIFCGQGKGFILLSVKDNGIGISKEDTSKIFDLHGRLNRDIDGQGIGLYLVKKIVNATNGNISIESEPGKGSKFSLQFKADQELIELEK